MASDSGIFDSLLTLEETYYEEGYNEGAIDGEKAGRNEGRAFGFEKGFEKFLEMGKMQGRIAVWKSRISQPPETTAAAQSPPTAPITNPRLIKHLSQFENIVSSPSTVNDEENVEEVDESLKRGRAKLKIICNMLGEKEHIMGAPESSSSAANAGEPNIEEGNFNKNVRR